MYLGELIKEYIEKHSVKDFLDKSGLSRAYTYMLINNKNNHGEAPKPSIDTIKTVATAIGKPFQEVLSSLDEDMIISITPKSTTNNSVEIPVIGKVAAGIPLEMIEDIIDTEEIPAEMAKHGEYFGLKINGDSMEPRIYKGDVVIVKQQSEAESGDIVIVTVNGDDATCKRLLKSESGITLLSLNSKYAPMVYSKKDVEKIPIRLIGKVVEVRGKLEF